MRRDISKGIYKIWHNGPWYKLKTLSPEAQTKRSLIFTYIYISVNQLNADLELSSKSINGKCNSTLIPINKQIKLFSLLSLTQRTKFNNHNIAKCSSQKHLGIVLDSKLNFNSPLDQKKKKKKNVTN